MKLPVLRKLSRLSMPAAVALGALAAAVAVVALGFVDAQFFNHAWAADPLEKVDSKGNELLDAMKGKFAITFTAIVLTITGLLMQQGRVPHTVGVRIVIGTLIVGGSASIAEWAYA